MKTIGLIIGTNRPNRIGEKIADWFVNNFDSSEISLEILDLKEENLPFLDEPEIPAKHQYTKDHTNAWSEKISKLDGVIILYPQYNWGYPAVLKNALDYLYDEWKGLPVSTVVYGNHGGFQAQIALNLVLHGLHMNVLNSQLSISIDTLNFDSSDNLNKYSADVAAIKNEFERIFA
jgi:NAD(P)H-dependent FMN reductase